MSRKHLLQRCWIKLKRDRFQKQFGAIDKTSGFGEKGYGDSCTIKGHNGIFIGKQSWFGKHSELIVYNSGDAKRAKLLIGNDVRATSRCRITCAGSIRIGDHVLMAPEVFITDHNHGMDPTAADGYSRQPLIVKPVQIGDGVWLGQRVCVLPGVTIGEHSIIGANSVVTHDIPPYSIAVGAPARVIKHWNMEQNRWEKAV